MSVTIAPRLEEPADRDERFGRDAPVPVAGVFSFPARIVS